MISGPPGAERGTVEQVALEAGMTAREAQVFLLATGDGLDYPAIATRLGVSPVTVQSLISKGRKKLLAAHRSSTVRDLAEVREEWNAGPDGWPSMRRKGGAADNRLTIK